MAKDREPPRRRLRLLPERETPRAPEPDQTAAVAAPCLRYHPPRHPADDDSPDRPGAEFAWVTLGEVGERLRDAAQLMHDLAGDSPGGQHPPRTERVEVAVGTLRFLADALRELGALCGETHRAEVLEHRRDN